MDHSEKVKVKRIIIFVKIQYVIEDSYQKWNEVQDEKQDICQRLNTTKLKLKYYHTFFVHKSYSVRSVKFKTRKDPIPTHHTMEEHYDPSQTSRGSRCLSPHIRRL